MALFRYQAINDEGKKTSGIIDAESLNEAKAHLIGRNVWVTKILLVTQKKNPIWSRKEVLEWTLSLSRLIEASMPLYDALCALEEKYRGTKLHSLTMDLCEKVHRGNSFSEALRGHPKIFDPLYCAMIHAGENSANLAAVVTQLGSMIQKQLALKKKILSALMYPAILGAFCLVILSALMFFVIPSLFDLFEGRKLHPLTQTVLSVSQWSNDHVYLLAITITILAFLFGIGSRLEAVKKFFRNFLFSFPYLKSFFVIPAIIRFFRTSSMLLESDIPLVTALSLSRKVMKHPPLETSLQKAETKVLEGSSLSHEFSKIPLIPPHVPRMIAIAEESGDIPSMLKQIADHYENDLEKNLNLLTSLLQPILLLVLGLIVGFVLLSVLLPLTDVSSFIEP